MSYRLLSPDALSWDTRPENSFLLLTVSMMSYCWVWRILASNISLWLMLKSTRLSVEDLFFDVSWSNLLLKAEFVWIIKSWTFLACFPLISGDLPTYSKGLLCLRVSISLGDLLCDFLMLRKGDRLFTIFPNGRL